VVVLAQNASSADNGETFTCTNFCVRGQKFHLYNATFEQPLLRVRGSYQSPQEAMVRKFPGEGECADLNIPLDFLQGLTRPAKIRFGRRALNGRPVSNPPEYEGALYSCV
jgi:hypothetical protein